MTSKVVVVGGTSGIGEATAQLFASLGAEVVVVGRDQKRLEECHARLTKDSKHKVTAKQGDASDQASLKTLFAEIGPFDHLVIAASGSKGAGPIQSLDVNDLVAGFEAKTFAHVKTLQASLATIKEGGSITLITAVSASVPLPGTSGLAAINGALESMVAPLALELAPKVRVNAVSPGVIATPWWDKMPDAFRDSYFAACRANLPVRRVGTPEDVAQAVVSLATNGFLTGIVLPVAGGAQLVTGK